MFLAWLKEQYAANGNPKLEDLPTSVLCSHCQINNMKTVQNSNFFGYNAAMVATYSKIFTSRCRAAHFVIPEKCHATNASGRICRVQCQCCYHA